MVSECKVADQLGSPLFLEDVAVRAVARVKWVCCLERGKAQPQVESFYKRRGE